MAINNRGEDKQNSAVMKNMLKNGALALGILGLVVGFGLGWFSAKGNFGEKVSVKNDKGEDVTNVENTATFANALGASSSQGVESAALITVSDQKAGKVVTAEVSSVGATTWVAVRDEKNGLVGNILGAKRIESGAAQKVEIPLLRSTVAGKTYFVVLFKDNGDKEFDNKTDSPMTTDGVLVSETFVAK